MRHRLAHRVGRSSQATTAAVDKSPEPHTQKFGHSPISRWLVQLTARVGWQKACVAMANKNARILWAVMTRDAGFDPRHVSDKPQARRSAAERLAASTPNMTPCPA
jgi:hypothetical protein